MKVYIEDNESIPAIQVLPDADPAPIGFTESTTVENLERYGQEGGFDFKQVREKIKTETAATGFSNLSTAEKKIASKYFAVSKADRDTVHSDAEQEENSFYYHEQSCISRMARVNKVEALIYNRLNSTDIVDVISDIKLEQLIELYIRHGVEGEVSGDSIEGLFDYIEGTDGTKYATQGALAGIAHRSYVPVVGTLADLVTDCMNILRGVE